MDTIEGPAYVRQRKRRHSAEFKVKVIEACRHPGVSIAGIGCAGSARRAFETQILSMLALSR